MAPSLALATGQSAAMLLGANPIRKVVNLLEKMKEKTEHEGEEEEELFKKYMCYCKKNKPKLEASIKAAEDKLPGLRSKLEAAQNEKAQLEAELEKAHADRSEAQKALADATALREKEQKSFEATSTEMEETIVSVSKAVKALSKGMADSMAFLQTGAAESLRKIVLDKDGLMDADRQELLAFLDTSHKSDYVPVSGEILGMLKQMGTETKKDLEEAKAVEADAIKEYLALKRAKMKEIKALTTTIEAKTARVGELGVVIVDLKSTIEDTEESLAEDNKYYAELVKGCDAKAKDKEIRDKTRSEELLAIEDTIKILDDDDALTTFNKALPNHKSLLQLTSTAASVKARAASALKPRAGGRHAVQMDLILLALRGKKIGFEKVIKMIEGMKKTLKKEQVSDDKKKDYCGQQFDSAGDKKQELTLQIEDKKTTIEGATQGIASLDEEMAELKQGIEELDTSVAEATEQRKKENQQYTKVMADNGAAKEILGYAKQRLNQFYNPKLVGEGEDASLVEVSAQREEDAEEGTGTPPPPPPDTYGDYKKKSSGSTGALAMMDTLLKDIAKQMMEAKTEEKYAQKDYGRLMTDSSAKRRADAKSLAQKTAEKADLDADLQAAKEAKASSTKELAATEKYLQNLHIECDWLLKNYKVREEARDGELASLDRAKAVLNGADYSFLQEESASARKRTGFLAPALQP
eukprot:TRINITY_DN105989_c0_g1_i1.p1 TRINITY_DN105989_c0_g1~~TRINITY_DN105989_c0_g1_i1.p1  ORF type:complete len:748 (-),score=243.85 TRINITY_DN105989_c0_g1_i1:6-2093(-)